MTGRDVQIFFEERRAEIEAYLDLLEEVAEVARTGPPRLQGSTKAISPMQQKILSSSLYLQLYNLVEATITRCIDAVAESAADGTKLPTDLNDFLRAEWIRAVARTHIELSPHHRLQAALKLWDCFITSLPIAQFRVEVGGGGNWDDVSIEKASDRLGCRLEISRAIKTAAKRHVRDNLGALKLVKNRRNGLAHGSLSFVDCSDGVTTGELRSLSTALTDYLGETVASFVRYVDVDDLVLTPVANGGA